jgi:hypothetical protein
VNLRDARGVVLSRTAYGHVSVTASHPSDYRVDASGRLPSGAVTDETPQTPQAPAPPAVPGDMPDYKGAPLAAERGPGLGCFWAQVVLLVMLLVLTPLSVYASAPSWLSAALLILILVLLFFVGQTMVFLLRLTAADRRTRRRPLASSARPTVGQIEDQQPAPQGADPDDTGDDEPLT